MEIVLRNSRETERQKVLWWIDALEKWGTDPYIMENSKKLNDYDNTYMLITTSDLRLFFSVEKDEITVMDVARKATILASRPKSGTDKG